MFHHPPLLHAPILALHIALLAAVIGALDGGYGLFHPQGTARAAGIGLGADAHWSAIRAQAGARLLAHACAAAALMQAPAVGACVAAGLGAGWLGAAGGRALGAALQPGGRRADALRALGAAAMGFALWGPLWSYLRQLRDLAQGTLLG